MSRDLAYSVSPFSSGLGPKTGVAIMSIDGMTRPILAVSVGRHATGKCYIQLPKGDKDFQDPINIIGGSFTNASASKNLVLFSGGSGDNGETQSVIYEIHSDGSFQQKWSDSSTTRRIRTGVFVEKFDEDNLDFLLAGYDKSTPNATYAVLYKFNNDNKNWTQDKQFNTPIPPGLTKPAFSVSIHAPFKDIIAIGNRINYSEFQANTSRAIQSSYITRTDGNNVQRITTNLQTTGIYIGSVVSNFVTEDTTDVICVGSGEIGYRGQCFLQRPDGTRINLGRPMDGRSVGVFDFTGNGLLDIFICCVSDPHCLLRQDSPGNFTPQYINNYNKEARGMAIGHLYNDQTIQVVITSASSLVPDAKNYIYSFSQPLSNRRIK